MSARFFALSFTAAFALVLAACSSNVVTLHPYEGDASPSSAPATDASATATAVDASEAGATEPTDASASADAPPAAPSLFVLTKDTATDPKTGLVWQRGELNNFYETPPDSDCAALVLDGKMGFRSATLTELQTLLVMTPTCPMIDHIAFPGAYCDWYLSSTLVGGDQFNEMMVDFYTGAVQNRNTIGGYNAFNARCVRTGP